MIKLTDSVLFGGTREPFRVSDWLMTVPTGRLVADPVTLSFVIGGESAVESAAGSLRAMAGHVLAIPTGMWCAAFPVGFCRAVSLYLRPSYVASQLEWLPVRHPLVGLLQTSSDRAHVGVLDIGAESMRVLAPKLIRFAATRRSRLQQLAALADLFDAVQQLGTASDRRARSAPLRPEVLRAMGAVEADLQHEWTLRDLARASSLSESQLTRLFVRDLGVPPGSWVWQRRLENMAELLGTRAMSVSEAAVLSGWRNPSAASRAFQRRFRVSPRVFAKRVRRTGKRSLSEGESSGMPFERDPECGLGPSPGGLRRAADVDCRSCGAL
ncbi:helix-turn-helix domain-containing protein [Microbacterium sp. 22303]|uniref:helix-turn-helix domain-containing protein n=1 Tax=Microbacterium sp. 22303 TaxID=3453905 RepID=UPI003F868474